MSHTLTSHEFLFTNGGNEVHTHTGPSVLVSCVCTSRLNRGGIVICPAPNAHIIGLYYCHNLLYFCTH